MERYWVVGGEYADTEFVEIAGGGAEERHGPYASYDEAKASWAGLSMARVDNAHVRYRIEREGGAAFWVVGGKYTGTDFTATVGDAPEERHGPFESYDEAKASWAGLSMAQVDDAHVRYRIEQE